MKTSPWILLALALSVGCGDDSSQDPDTDDGSSSSSSTDPTNSSDPTTDPGTSSSSTTDESTSSSTSVTDPGSSSESGSESSASSSSTGAALREVTVQFAGRINGVDAACDTVFTGLGSGGNDAQIRDFRFYVSNVRLVDEDGNEVAVELEQDGVWQYEDVALLDFEDATGLCSGMGNADLNSAVVGTVPEGNYDGIRFDIGVPNALNHTDPNTAEPPLNVLPMNWSWLAGRKFVRFDLDVDTGEVDENENPVMLGWNTHLGSSGCTNGDPNNPMQPPAQDCTRPQRPAIAFDSFDPDTNAVVVDAGTLLASADVSSDPVGAPGCMSSFPVDANCADLFPAYGLDWDTGTCLDNCAQQTFVTIE